MASSDARSRKWVFILYRESAPECWMQLLEEQHVPAVVSPLHDKDLDGNGDPKKKHWHIMMMFDGLQRYEHVRKISQDLLHGTIPLQVQSERSMVRYFIHADQPDKYQYDRANIITLNGANINKWFEDNGNADVFYAIIEFARDSNISEIADLYDVVNANRSDPELKDWRSYLAVNHHAQAVDRYLRSRRYGLATSTKISADSRKEN